MAISEIEKLTYYADFEELKLHKKGRYTDAVISSYFKKYGVKPTKDQIRQVMLGRMADYRILNEMRLFFGLPVHYSEQKNGKRSFGLKMPSLKSA